MNSDSCVASPISLADLQLFNIMYLHYHFLSSILFLAGQARIA